MCVWRQSRRLEALEKRLQRQLYDIAAYSRYNNDSMTVYCAIPSSSHMFIPGGYRFTI